VAAREAIFLAEDVEAVIWEYIKPRLEAGP